MVAECLQLQKLSRRVYGSPRFEPAASMRIWLDLFGAHPMPEPSASMYLHGTASHAACRSLSTWYFAVGPHQQRVRVDTLR